MLLPVAPDNGIQPFGQGIHDRQSDTVQSTGNLITLLVELPARVKRRHDYFHGRSAVLRMYVRRYSSSVIAHGCRSVAVDSHFYVLADAGHRLVDAVVEYFVDKVMQTPVVCASYVHAGSLPHCLETFQDLNAVGVVTVIFQCDHVSLSGADSLPIPVCKNRLDTCNFALWFVRINNLFFGELFRRDFDSRNI